MRRIKIVATYSSRVTDLVVYQFKRIDFNFSMKEIMNWLLNCPLMRCRKCKGILDANYSYIIGELQKANLLEYNFKPLCCRCQSEQDGQKRSNDKD